MKDSKMKAKRILAFALCLCMAMSILPMSAAAAGAEEIKIKFDDIAIRADYLYPSGVSISGAAVGALQVVAPKDAWIAYDVGSLKAGYYEGIVSCVPYDGGAEFDFYIVPKGDGDATAVNAALVNAEPIGAINGSGQGSPNANNVRRNFVDTYLPSDGEYMLVCKYLSGNPYAATVTEYAILLRELHLKRLGGADDFSNKASIDFTDGAIPSIKSGSAYAPTFVVDDELTPDVDERHNYFRFSGGEIYQYNAFDIGNIEAGNYKGTINYAKVNDANLPGGIFDIYLIPVNPINTNVPNALIYALNPDAQENENWEEDKAIKIATVDCSSSAENVYWQNCTFAVDGLKAGKYYLVATQALSTRTYVRLQGFDMVPADFEYATVGVEANADGKALFGDNYAYIRKDGDAWVVNFFGGIKKTEGYTEVGFAVNGVEYGSNKVYSTLSIGGQKIDNADFGTGVGFIFTEEVELDSVPESVEFQAYAKTADGATVYGNTYTAVIE